MNRNEHWTDEKLKLLEEYWADGVSARVIAERFGKGFTRNSVIGKVHRMKFTARREKPPSPAEPSKPLEPSKPVVKLKPPPRRVIADKPVRPVRPVITLQPGEPLTLLHLTAKTCRWPIGDPGVPGFHFCGELPKRDSPYCDRHRAVAYTPLRRFG